ncbi:MAG: HAD-IIA family hydrolase [Pseudomonadota bacterium]
MKYKAILADLDGTLYRGSVLIPGADVIYRKMTDSGISWLFLSNNATTLAEDLAAKITNMGLPVSSNHVITSASAVVREIEKNFVGAPIMVIGSQRLTWGLELAGANITHNHSAAQVVVVALDREFTYEKMKRAHKAIQRGATFWATNMYPTYPEADGMSPGAGSVVSSIATAAGKKPDRVFGKPSTDMAHIAMKRLGIGPEDCLVVGDRMDTDIEFAIKAGMASALVLTGATSREEITRYAFSPTHIIDSIAMLENLF